MTNSTSIKHADFDILLLTMSRWDGLYSSASISLAKELALNNRVFFIDHPFTLKDFWKRRSTNDIQSRKEALLWGKNIYRNPAGFPKNFTAVTTKLVLPINPLPAGVLYDLLSRLNDGIVFSAIHKTIRDFGIKKFIFLNSFDPFYMRHFPSDFKPELFIYQTRDDISQAKHSAKHGVRLEDELVKKADFVLATSKSLTESKSRINPRTYHLPNAADIELFSAAKDRSLPKPAELSNRTGKVILYMGNIGWARVDFPLLKKIADSHQDWTLLLVGPTDSEEQIKVGLDKMPNVIFTGSKKISELPAYVAHSDCTLIPFQCNTLTKSIYPLKINEYLAAGKSVVATNFSDDILQFKDVAYLAGDHDEFIKMIEKSLLEDSPQKQSVRIKVAEGNSWQARAQTFWELVERHLR